MRMIYVVDMLARRISAGGGLKDPQSFLCLYKINDLQPWLLNHLPQSSSVSPIVINSGDPESLPEMVARDTDYERLIAATKAAHRKDGKDRGLDPASLDWEFALAVLKLRSSIIIHELALRVGWREAAPTMVGSLAAGCSCRAVHHRRWGFSVRRGRRTRKPVSPCAFQRRLPGNHFDYVFRFAKNRRTADGKPH